MNNKKYDVRSWLEKYLPLLIPAATFSFLLPSPIIFTVLIALLAGWLYLTLTDEEKYIKSLGLNPFGILILAYLILQVCSLLYSENIAYGVRRLEGKIPLAVFPIVFFTGHNILKKVKLQAVLEAFVHIMFAACIFIVIRILFHAETAGQAWNEYTFTKISSFVAFHPGYFSLYLCFAIIILIVRSEASKLPKILTIVELLTFGVFVVRLASRMPLVGLALCLLVFFILRRRYVAIVLSALFALTVGLLMFQNEDFKERYLKPLQLAWSGNTQGLMNYTFNRVQIYSCATEVLSAPTFIFGVGVGDANDELMRCYNNHDYWWVAQMEYNAHNEYLQSTLEVGIAGGLILLSLLFLPCIRPTHKEFAMFCILFGIFSLTESTLQVQKGVLFFAYFYSLFASFTIRQQPS